MDTGNQIQKAIEVLQQYNAWRKYGEADKPDPRDVDEALDTAITMLKSLIYKPTKEYYGA